MLPKTTTHKLHFLTAILLSVVLFSSCGGVNRDEKAQKLAKDYLFKKLPDFQSYEAIEFSKVDSNHSSLEDNKDYRYVIGMLPMYEMNLDHSKSMADIITYDKEEKQRQIEDSKKYTLLVDSFRKKMNDFESNFKPVFDGWKVDHTFRAKNEKGVSAIRHYRFVYDLNLDSVTYMKDLDAPKPKYLPYKED